MVENKIILPQKKRLNHACHAVLSLVKHCSLSPSPLSWREKREKQIIKADSVRVNTGACFFLINTYVVMPVLSLALQEVSWHWQAVLQKFSQLLSETGSMNKWLYIHHVRRRFDFATIPSWLYNCHVRRRFETLQPS
jgi:hypothetical protein